jgi:hypothetical protein
MDEKIDYSPDSSLQRWGRNLKTVAPALTEQANGMRSRKVEMEAVAGAMRKLSEQGDTDLPADKDVVAEMQRLTRVMEEAAREQAELEAKVRRYAAVAETLGNQYQRQHKMDEDRLNGTRGGRAREKRADVGNAEQDT